MLRVAPYNLFDATAAGVTLSKLIWPGTLTNTLPVSPGIPTAITSSGSTVGGIFTPDKAWPAVLLDFAAVGTADQSLVVEVGKLQVTGAIAMPLASVTLKSITTAGTVANVNPYTGAATAGTTWRLFDAVTITEKDVTDQVSKYVGGAEDDTPSQLLLTTTDAKYFYIVITTLPGALTEVICVLTPTAQPRTMTKGLA